MYVNTNIGTDVRELINEPSAQKYEARAIHPIQVKTPYKRELIGFHDEHIQETITKFKNNKTMLKIFDL